MDNNKMVVRTRIAPSPTGELHIGNLRTILYDYALAKKFKGQFIWRVEDTDQKRFVAGSLERMLATVKAYGLNWDEGPDIGGPHAPYIQTQRLVIYQKYLQILLEKNLAYYCFSTPEELEIVRKSSNRKAILRYDRKWLSLTPAEISAKINSGENHYIRLKIPDNQIIEFEDLIRGKIKTNSNEIDDQVLFKSDGIPTYHFAATIDDHLMEISHVLRGEEWLPSTPKHVILNQYFNWTAPKYVHLTLFLDPANQGKMSKRSGATHAQAFLDDGYLPEAMLNFLMLLGWNSGEDNEILSLSDFIQKFDITKLNKKAAVFDRKKLDYFNGYYLRQKDNKSLLSHYQKFLPKLSSGQLEALIPLTKERITKFSDLIELCRFIYETPKPNPSLFLTKISKETAQDMLLKSLDIISSTTLENLQPKLLKLIESNNWKVGDFFLVFRAAISGQSITPPVVECLTLIGQNSALNRLKNTLKALQDH